MPNSQDREFSDWMKLLIDRICSEEGITRTVLATELGVSSETIFRAVYEAKVGIDFILNLCRRADATPEELWEVELAWMRTKEDRPREQVFKRAMSVIRLLMGEVDKMEGFLRKKDLFDEYMRKRKGKLHPLHARSKKDLEQKG